jgi:hypothetical protein
MATAALSEKLGRNPLLSRTRKEGEWRRERGRKRARVLLRVPGVLRRGKGAGGMHRWREEKDHVVPAMFVPRKKRYREFLSTLENWAGLDKTREVSGLLVRLAGLG